MIILAVLFVVVVLAVRGTALPGDPNHIHPYSAPQNITCADIDAAKIVSQSTCSDHQVVAAARNGSKSSTNTTGQAAKKLKSAVSSSASASLRRIKKEYKDVVQMGICYDWVKGRLITSSTTNRHGDDVRLIAVGPLATNLRHWHFSFRGVKNSLYESGIYHGRILLPKDYPTSPPRVQLMTPSGRFKPFADICLSASAFHPETWTPRWTVLSLVHALRLHMLTSPQEIGGVVSSADETLEYARRSLSWKFAWVVGSTKIVVDHATLIEQGALAIEIDQDVPTVEALLHPSPLDYAKDLNTPNRVPDVPVATSSGKGLGLDASSKVDRSSSSESGQGHATRAIQTLEKASAKKTKTEKTSAKSKSSHSGAAPMVQIPHKNSVGTVTKSLVRVVAKVVAKPTTRRIFFLILIWLVSKR
jgi:ubiquitin-protein ligase